MYCCAHCIGDYYLSTADAQAFYSSTTIGTCDYCDSTDEKLVEPERLFDRFSLFLSIYDESAMGDSLLEMIRYDWPLFQPEKIRVESAMHLLADILDIPDLKDRRFTVTTRSSKIPVPDWDGLREELLHKNRFFLSSSLDKDEKFETLLQALETKPDAVTDKLFRARIMDGTTIFKLSEMGAPPPAKATQGRANPSGISYLYLASDNITAICELRPHVGDLVCVAEFEIRSCRLIDLRQPRVDASPFKAQSEEDLLFMRSCLRLLEQLGEELSHPVRPQTAHIEYVPSQYLCEYIKSRGYSGVVYRSSLGKGFNVALFDTLIAKAVELKAYSVNKVDVVIEKHNPIEPT
jgi:hypothetical protein